MEEKKNMSAAELESALSGRRSTVRLAKALTYGCGVAMILCFLTSLIPLAIFFLLLTLGFGIWLSGSQKKLKTLLSENVISSVLKEVFDEVDYNPFKRISSVDEAGMVFPFSYDKIDGNDFIKASYKGLQLELSDIELISVDEVIDDEGITHTSESRVFRGQWLICDFGKELSGDVHLSGKSKKFYGRAIRGNVKMENELFNKRFYVNAEDPQEAYYIFTPHMMEYILSMSDKSGGTVYMSFLKNGKLHLAVQTNRDFFELGNSSTDLTSLQQKFLAELHWFTDLIDELRLGDSYFS